MRIKIRGWETHFEKDRTKQWKTLQWVPIPNKQGLGYKTIMMSPKGLEIFACWNALVQQASKCDPRGDLSKYSIAQLSILTMIDEKKLGYAVEFLSTKLDWIIVLSDLDNDVNDLDNDVNDLDQHGKSNGDSCSILFSSIQFNSIYDVYPRKVGRAVAIKAIHKALKKIGYDELLKKTQDFAESVEGKDMNYIPHPATWFNQERYNDPIEHQVPEERGRSSPDNFGQPRPRNEYDGINDN